MCYVPQNIFDRYESNQNAYQLLAFKKSIKREVSQYTIPKDEKYIEAFKRNLLVTATTHGCDEILEGDDSQELFIPNNISCTVSSTNYYSVIWVKP